MTEQLFITLLGGLDVQFRGRRLTFPTRHAGFLIALLALGGPHRRELAATRLWGEREDEQARASLRQTVFHIQKVMAAADAPKLQVDRVSVSLHPSSFLCDAVQVLEDPSDTRGLVAAAQAELLGDVGRVDPAFEDWLSETRASFTHRISDALQSTAKDLKRSENWDELASVASAILHLDPFDEAALRLKVIARLHMRGRGSALTLFDEFKEQLQHELQVAPETETLDLYDQIRSGVLQSSKQEPLRKLRSSEALLERRHISLVALESATISRDPEEFRNDVDALNGQLKSVLTGNSASVLENTGALSVGIFAGGYHVERHAEAAVAAAKAVLEKTHDRVKAAVVTGTILQADEIDAESVAHLVEEARDLLNRAHLHHPEISADVAERLAVRSEPSLFHSRTRELLALEDKLDLAGKGLMQVVAVVGEAGLGKSTLVRQFLRDHRPQRVFMIEGFDREIGRSFGALARFWVTLLDDDPTVLERFVSAGRAPTGCIIAIESIVRRPAEGIDHASIAEHRRLILETTSAFILDSARNGNQTILLVEDLHWLDPDTLECLDWLIGEATATPLLIVTTSRPEFQVPWLGRSAIELVRLHPFSDEDARALVAPWVEGLDEKSLVAILDRAQGNPFFLIETARSTVATQDHGIPGTIHDVLSWQLHRRPKEERRILQYAAIFGSEFSRIGLSTVLGIEPEELDKHLHNLRLDEVIVSRGPSTGQSYRFRHILLQEAAYASIPHKHRPALHGDAFEVLVHDKDIAPSELAQHAKKAKRWKQAVNCWVDAGDMYAQLSSYELASQAYQNAVHDLMNLPEDADRLKKRAKLALKLRPVLVPLGRYGDALQELELAEEVACTTEDLAAHTAALISKSYLFSTHGRLDEAISTAQAAAHRSDKGTQLGYEAGLAEAQARSLKGDWAQAINLLEPSISYWESNLHERFGHTGTRSVWCHGHLSNAYCVSGQLGQAMVHAERAFDIASETRRPLDMVFALHRLVRVNMARGDHDEAVSLSETAMQITKEVDAPIFQSWFACDAVYAYLNVERVADAKTLFDRQWEMARKLDLKQFEAWLNLRHAQLLLATGLEDLAKRAATLALKAAHEIGDLVLEPTSMLFLADNCSEGEQSARQSEALHLLNSRGISLDHDTGSSPDGKRSI